MILNYDVETFIVQATGDGLITLDHFIIVLYFYIPQKRSSLLIPFPYNSRNELIEKASVTNHKL